MSKLTTYFLDVIDKNAQPLLRNLSQDAHVVIKILSVKKGLFRRKSTVSIMTGIMVNGKFILVNDPVILRPGDAIEFTQEGIKVDLTTMIKVSGRG